MIRLSRLGRTVDTIEYLLGALVSREERRTFVRGATRVGVEFGETGVWGASDCGSVVAAWDVCGPWVARRFVALDLGAKVTRGGRLSAAVTVASDAPELGEGSIDISVSDAGLASLSAVDSSGSGNNSAMLCDSTRSESVNDS